MVSLQSRDEAGPRIALQVLVYPVTDLSSFDTQSYQESAEGYSLTAPEMEWFRDQYLAHPRGCPLRPCFTPAGVGSARTASGAGHYR